jgi:O-antigen/teichoic acid export membrane protein
MRKMGDHLRNNEMTNTRGSYAAKYVKTYVWQVATILTGFLSMFIVVPHVSSRPAIYGIYTVCLSISIFLSYADLGFITSASKFAGESFSRGEQAEETKLVGFAVFMLSVPTFVYSLLMLYLAKNPGVLISNFDNPEQVATAGALLFIMAVFSPMILIQRIMQIIFGVRIETYVYRKLFVVGNLLKVLSVFVFVRGEQYNIVGYFLTCQVVDLVASVSSAVIAKRRYAYDFMLLAKSFRFSLPMYAKTKSLAFGSLFGTVMWILFYEIDAVVIGRAFGPKELSFYAIGLSLVALLRSLFSQVYAPFSARFNHFVGLDDIEGLRKLYKNVIVLTMPMVVFTILSLVILMKPFVYSWVGEDYAASVILAQFLALSYARSFVSYPGNFLVVAQERISLLYVTSALLPTILWTGVLITISTMDVLAIPVFKMVASLPVFLIYVVISYRFLRVGFVGFLRRLILPAMIPCLVLVGTLLFVTQYMPTEKSVLNVLIVVSTGAGASSVASLLYYGFSAELRHCLRPLLAWARAA